MPFKYYHNILIKRSDIMNPISTNPARHARGIVLQQIKNIDTKITKHNDASDCFSIAAGVAFTFAACAQYPLSSLCFGIAVYNGIGCVAKHQLNALTQEKDSLIFLNDSLELIENSMFLPPLFRPTPLILVISTITVIENHLTAYPISISRDLLSSLVCRLKSVTETLNLIAQNSADDPEVTDLIEADVEIYPIVGESMEPCIALPEPSAPSFSLTK